MHYLFTNLAQGPYWEILARSRAVGPYKSDRKPLWVSTIPSKCGLSHGGIGTFLIVYEAFDPLPFIGSVSFLFLPSLSVSFVCHI